MLRQNLRRFYSLFILLSVSVSISAFHPLLAISVDGSCSQNELDALMSFRSQLGFAEPIVWNLSVSCCNWWGIKCSMAPSSSTPTVQELSLPGLNLTGILSPFLGNLTNLKTLNLSGNLLTGSIPPELSYLQNLKRLDLSNNSFSGAIPVDFSIKNLSLLLLNLSCNAFFGISPTFENLNSLEVLDLSNNLLTGSLPKQICHRNSRIRILNFTENYFSGFLPLEFANCTQLEIFAAANNNLTGILPPSYTILRSLKYLCLSTNSLSGPLYPALANWTNLTFLDLSSNRLSGIIPRELGSLPNLEELSLGFNLLHGEIPPELSNCKHLKSLSLNNNNLNGSIDLDYSSLSSLVTLELSYNTFSGSIPSSLGKAFGLETLALASNKFSDEIPRQLGDLKNLTSLSISRNFLVGSLPETLQNCEKLVSLIVTRNYFTQPLPQNITGFPNLQIFAIANVNLTGLIPSWLRNCKKLQVLDLSWNHFSGEIPDWLGDFEHLIYLDLSNNSFSGNIPLGLANLHSLQNGDDNMTGLQPLANTLFIKRNQNSTVRPYNRVSAFPPSLLLSHNALTGAIPGAFGKLRKLQDLELQNNQLTGLIPDSVADAKSLETIDLSNNHLSGPIPSSLVNLTFLSFFNVSFNDLTGYIPHGNQFSDFTNMSYLGNPHLCGAPLNECSIFFSHPNRPARSHMPSKLAITGIVLSLALAFAGVFTMMVLWSLSRRRVVHQEDEFSKKFDLSLRFSETLSATVNSFQNQNLKHLTVADLVKATDNFDQANIIGCGGFGLVFRATLADGVRLAIKRLTGDGLQIDREFEAEVQTLGRVKHANLVSLQGYCKYGVDRLLVYSYMENGSLDYWLHERNDGGLKLDWPTRLKIAQGTGRGLAYLHEICKPHIVHRDVKSSNILLDEMFEAHVGDFGLARLMVRSDTHVTTELVGTLGYIPPEYGQAWIATLRGDVYSFGVVILELLTRKRPIEVCKPRGALDLVAWVRKMKSEGKAEDTFDPILRGIGHEKEMVQVLEVAALCLKKNPEERPSIQEIVSLLEDVGPSLQHTK